VNWHLEIGALSLAGVDPASAGRIGADVERELAELLRASPAPGAFARGGALHLDEARIQLPAGTRPDAMGGAIARALHERIATQAGGEVSTPTDLGAPSAPSAPGASGAPAGGAG